MADMGLEVRGVVPMRLPSSHLGTPLNWLKRPLVPTVLPPAARLYALGAMVSISGLLYGLDTGSIGPITTMDSFVHVAGGTATFTASLHGFFVASILLSASLSSLGSGYVADKISRRFGIALGAAIFSAGSAFSAASNNLGQLFVARLITGIGAGQTISVGTIYLLEIATANVRGKLACLLQFELTIGIMLGYFITYASQRFSSSLSWRLPFVVQASFAALLAVLTLVFVPFSPRWLVQHGREDEALANLRILRLTHARATAFPLRNDISSSSRQSQELAVQQELTDIKAAVAAHRHIENRGASFRELFHLRYRKRVGLGILIMSFQQLSGIDVVLYFAPTVFGSVFSSQTASFLASGVMGIILVVSTVPAQIYFDRWGRKPMMVLGGAFMTASFLIIGALFAAYGKIENGQATLQGSDAVRFTVIALIYAFVSCFSLTWAPCTRVYAMEIVPTRLRSRAAATQQLANWLTNFSVALIAPIFLKVSPSGPYFLFGGCTLVATCICAVYMRETKNRTLEQIDQLFDDRTS